MADENVSPPISDVPDEVPGITAGQGMEIAPEPTNVETTGNVEETTQKTNTEASDTPTEPAQVQEEKAEGDAEHSSKTISDLGEDRKRLASELIDLARESDTAADKIKELMEADPRMEKLIKTKFGKDYDKLKSGESLKSKEEVVQTENLDLEKIKEQARVEARAEILMKEAELTKAKQFETFAKQSSLNSEEADEVKANAELLEDKYGYEQALDMSLRLVNKDKAVSAPGYKPPSGGQESSVSPAPKHEATPELDTFAKRAYGYRGGEQVAKGLENVEEQISSDGRRMTLRME